MTMSPTAGRGPFADAHPGGCLCGGIRYRTMARPVQTMVCHCTFCQRLTGSAFLVEPIFKEQDVIFEGEAPRVYQRLSDGSGMRVDVNFCGRCGTTLFLAFERFPGFLGVCGGTFDDPNWFDRGPGKGRHIFTRWSQKGVAFPPGVELYADHMQQLDGTPNTPCVLSAPSMTANIGGVAPRTPASQVRRLR